jgi:glycosyltransferase involved in cell wall biosynthesis
MQDRNEGPLQVCFFGTYRSNYVRNQVIINGLRSQNVEVQECHVTLWHSVADRVKQAGGGWRHPSFWWRVIRSYWKLIRAHGDTHSYDIMFIGYPGQFDVFLGRLLSWWRRKPMVLDILMSLHLIAEERGLTQQSPFTGRMIFWLERTGLRLPDLLIADTPEYERYYCQKYQLSPHRFHRIPLGVDDRIYYPRPNLQPPSDYFRVIYYGTFIPLHGVETMIQAAAELRQHSHIKFDFYGDGQERSRAEQLAQQLGLNNVGFRGWINKEQLPAEIARSHICLGVFGTTKQSRCTIQNKIWEAMMMQRPIISGDADTIRAELIHKVHVYLVERSNPAALAAGILELEANPSLRQQIASSAFERVQANTIAAIGVLTKQALLTLMSKEA